MKLSRLLQNLPLTGPAPLADPEVGALAYDSRQVQPGTLFFALPGLQADGLSFLPAAVANGAVAVVAERTPPDAAVPVVQVENARAALARVAAEFYGHPARELRVAGVTGTNGKTTTAYLLKHLLDQAGKPAGLIGTIHYAIGPEEIPAARTTPEAPEIQSLLRRMVEARCKAVSMEVSSHALVQHRVDGMEFDAAIFTNLTQDHLDYHGTMEAYFEAKSLLFGKLADLGQRKGRAIINIDDRFGHRLMQRLVDGGRAVSFGLGIGANFRAKNIRIEPTGTTFGLVAKGREYLVRLPLIGLFNVYNALGALAAANALGVELRAAVGALSKAPQVPGRLQRVPAKRNFQVFVDYAHTPDALENVLRTIKELMPERVITVFGCGGDRDKTKRPLMAAAAEKYSDYLVVTSDNPRTEDPQAILADIVQGLRGQAYEVEVDRAAAIRRAVALAGPGDIVLIAGKGHENYQEVHGKRLPFDDVQQAGWAIQEKKVEIE